VHQFGVSSAWRIRLLNDSQKALSDGRPGREKAIQDRDLRAAQMIFEMDDVSAQAQVAAVDAIFKRCFDDDTDTLDLPLHRWVPIKYYMDGNDAQDAGFAL
jgi:hypothetical protein